jgi:hypothetical protein
VTAVTARAVRLRHPPIVGWPRIGAAAAKGRRKMATGLQITSVRMVLKATRQAMFGLGVAVFVGIVGQAAAIYLAAPATDRQTSASTASARPREPGLRVPQHSGFVGATRRFEAVYGRDFEEAGEAR